MIIIFIFLFFFYFFFYFLFIFLFNLICPIGIRQFHIHANAAQPIRRHLPMRPDQREIRRVDDDNLLAVVAGGLHRRARQPDAGRAVVVRA